MQDILKLDTNAMEWEREFNEGAKKELFKKSLANDPETGVMVTVTKYPAGFINPKHTHHCAHGMYVLKGILHTSEGDFGPGSFLWFPEGKVMWHGATENEAVEIIFITNKQFDMTFL